jgi:serine/threonine protein kinase
MSSGFAQTLTSPSRKPLEEGRIMGMFVQILLALHFCQTGLPGRAQVLHRDLKPENSMYIAAATTALV